MTAFVGAIRLSEEDIDPLWAGTAEGLFRQSHEVCVVKGSRGFVTWVDLGIWSASASLVDGNEVALLAGDPVSYCGDTRIDVASALSVILRDPCGIDGLLARSYGTFCGLRVDVAEGQVVLFTDRLGVRPVYVAEVGGHLFFSSALWLIESLCGGTLRPDMRGITEISVFGYPLSDRSPYENVKTILESEVWIAGPRVVSRRQYFNWNRVKRADVTSEELANAIDSAFLRAVMDRRTGREETAFLSGGMDSRYIVAKLVERGASVSTLNFAPSGSQDLVLGQLASLALGTRHFQFPLGPGDFGRKQSVTIAAWLKEDPAACFRRLVWSGDGGSVGVGHVYLSPRMVELCGLGKWSEAAECISSTNKWRIPSRVFKKAYRPLAAVLDEGVRAELERWSALGGKAAYMFLMTNDQRRHLANHYEEILDKGFDFILPFFDARLVQLVVSAPLELLLGHRIYNSLLLSLQGGISHVPWQAYPGHLPCPLRVPEGLRYQWADCYDENDTRSMVKKDAWSCLQLARLPVETPLSRVTLVTAWALTTLSVRNLSFYARYAEPFFRYCGGVSSWRAGDRGGACNWGAEHACLK